MRSSKPLAERFWDKVDKATGLGPNGDCWEWTGARQWNGYGRIFVYWDSAKGSRSDVAHRVGFELQFGPIPTGTHVRHRCDNRVCVRGEHLELGSAADNVRDMHSRGRARTVTGADSPAAKLTESDVREILRLHESGLSHREIATRVNVGKTMVGSICSGQKWKGLIRVAV